MIGHGPLVAITH